MQQDIAQWLVQWTADNLDLSQAAETKGDMQDAARRLVADGEAAGFTIQALKDGADGDIEEYLMQAQNARHVAD